MSYTVEIPCKPYVKRFIEKSCGNPADLKNFQDLQSIFMEQLKKGCKESYVDVPMIYSDVVLVSISEYSFYRYGYELDKGGMLRFNARAEWLAKSEMRMLVTFGVISGYKAVESIHMFQEEQGYSEEIWSYESIRKDFNRHAHKDLIRLRRTYMRKMRDLISKKVTAWDNYQISPDS